MMGGMKNNPHIQGKGMVGVPHLATFHSTGTTKAMMSKVLLRGRPLNPEGKSADRICRDKNTVSQEPQCARFRSVFTCSPIV